MAKIVTYKSTPYKSVNFKQLNEYTEKEELSCFDFAHFEWSKVKEVHILGNTKNINNDDIELSSDFWGVYYNSTKDWILILCDSRENISEWLPLLGEELVHLDIRFINKTHINLSHLKNLKRLNLANNSDLVNIEGLSCLCNLSDCDLSYTCIREFPKLDNFLRLHSLNIRSTSLSKLSVSINLDKLEYLDIANTVIEGIDFIIKFPALLRLSICGCTIEELPELDCLSRLESLNCSKTPLKILPSLEKLSNLKSLNLGYSKISTLEGIALPVSLQTLVLEATPIKVLECYHKSRVAKRTKI